MNQRSIIWLRKSIKRRHQSTRNLPKNTTIKKINTTKRSTDLIKRSIIIKLLQWSKMKLKKCMATINWPPKHPRISQSQSLRKSSRSQIRFLGRLMIL